jgi:hypothetical protein
MCLPCRGMRAWPLAGPVTLGFAWVFGEPQIDLAIGPFPDGREPLRLISMASLLAFLWRRARVTGPVSAIA